MNYKYTYESPLGTMIMLGTLTYLTDLFFVDESHAPTYDDAEYIEQKTGPFEVTIMWLDQYFKGQKPFITFNYNDGTSEEIPVYFGDVLML